MNLGSIDMDKVRRLAARAGITDVQLAQALAEHHLTGLTFAGAQVTIDG